MKISILIPVFNGIDYTKTCLQNLSQQIKDNIRKEIVFEIIVIDDGSTDGTSEWMLLHFPEVKILFGDGSLWWSGSINKGMQYAFETSKADVVLWWNNDILAGDGYFAELTKQLIESDFNIVFGSKIYQSKNKSIIWGMGGHFNTFTGLKGMNAFNIKDSVELESPITVDWLPGMGTIITRKVYKDIGLLNCEDFPQYHGDSDYTFRANLAGFVIKVLPELKIYNDTENSGMPHGYSFKVFCKSFSSIKSKYNLKKNFIFYRKYATSPRAFLFLLKEYYRYIGGFIKWSILYRLGIKRRLTK